MSRIELTAENKRRKKLFEELGIKVLDWSRSGAHLKFRLELPGGEKKMLVAPISSGDRRGDKNLISMVKRWLKSPSAT